MIGGVWGCEGGRGYVVVREGKGMGYEGGRGCGVMREGVVGGEGELPWVRGSGVLWVVGVLWERWVGGGGGDSGCGVVVSWVVGVFMWERWGYAAVDFFGGGGG